MKLLLALSVLVSASVCAQTTFPIPNEEVRCYESAGQGGHGELAYFLGGVEANTEKQPGFRFIFWPYKHLGLIVLNPQFDCLQNIPIPVGNFPLPKLVRFCRGEGQRINGLIPIEVETEYHDRTVYCDKEIKHWFEPISTR